MKQDLTGQRFGYLTVINEVRKEGNPHRYWLCRCDCGNEKVIEGSHLKNGHTKSCGCYRREVRKGIAADLAGMRFGHLTVLGEVPGRIRSEAYWLCRCDCGSWSVCRQEQLKNGQAKSCGCGGKKKLSGAAVQFGEKNHGRKRYSNNTSGQPGVYRKEKNRWKAAIGFHGKVYHLGTFRSYEDAVEARKKTEEILSGFMPASEKTSE